MKRVLRSTPLAFGALLLVMLILVLSFKLRSYWWSYFDIFFAFMMVFCHLIALMFAKINARASARLDFIALICGILTVVGFVVEWVLFRFVV